MLSIVVPIFNEASTLVELHRAIVAGLSSQSRPYEIIFVDDGSSDATAQIANNLSPLRLVRMQRNYGQTPAIDTGIYVAKGDIIVLIDADMQNDPADIPRLIEKLDEGYDVVIGWRQNRKDHWTRLFFSRFANFTARHFLGLAIHDFGCGLKAYRSRFIKDFRLWGEAQVFLPAVAKQRGARITEIPVTHHARTVGASKIKFGNMIRGGFDLIGIVFFVRYFSKPLRFFGGWGLVSTLIAIIVFGVATALRLAHIVNFTETPLPVVGTLFAIPGVMLFMMGLLAEMLLRMHYSATNSSPYFIREIVEKA